MGRRFEPYRGRKKIVDAVNTVTSGLVIPRTRVRISLFTTNVKIAQLAEHVINCICYSQLLFLNGNMTGDGIGADCKSVD